MKKIIIYILFLFTIVVVCYAMVEKDALKKQQIDNIEAGEASQQTDQVLNVLIRANSYADITVQAPTSFFSQFVRRYRPAGFLIDKLYDYLADDQKSSLTATIKTTSNFALAYAAHQKYDGYYIYSLCRIII